MGSATLSFIAPLVFWLPRPQYRIRALGEYQNGPFLPIAGL